MNKETKELLNKLIKITNEKKIKFSLIPNNAFEEHCNIIYVFIENHFEDNLKALEEIQEKNNKLEIIKQTFNTALYEIYKERNIKYSEYIDYYKNNTLDY